MSLQKKKKTLGPGYGMSASPSKRSLTTKRSSLPSFNRVSQPEVFESKKNSGWKPAVVK